MCFTIAIISFSLTCAGPNRAFDMAFYGALTAMFAELRPIIDDNMTIPVFAGAAMQFTAWRLGVPGSCLGVKPIVA